MKKLLSILLATLCVMNLTVVSFAAEDVSYFDEETGTLTIDNDEQWEEIIFDENTIIVDGEEWPEKYYEIYEKVEVLKLGRDVAGCSKVDGTLVTGFIYRFPNLREVIVDENNDDICVYDGLVYTKDKKVLVYIPPKNNDSEIYLPEELIDTCFDMRFYVTQFNCVFSFDDEHAFDIYITGGKKQIEQMSMDLLRWLTIADADAVYVNATKEELDSILFEEYDGSLCDLEYVYLNALSNRYQTYYFCVTPDEYSEFSKSLDYLMSDYPEYDGNGDKRFYDLERSKETYRRKLAYCAEAGSSGTNIFVDRLFNEFFEMYSEGNKIQSVYDKEVEKPNPQPPVEPEQPVEEPSFWDEIVGFFNKISNFFIIVFDWFKNLLGF